MVTKYPYLVVIKLSAYEFNDEIIHFSNNIYAQ